EPHEGGKGEPERSILQSSPGGSPRLVAPDALPLDVELEHLDFVSAAHRSRRRQWAFSAGVGRVERGVPVDSEDPRSLRQSLNEILEAKRVLIPGDPAFPPCRLRHCQTARPSVLRWIAAADAVELRGLGVETNRI